MKIAADEAYVIQDLLTRIVKNKEQCTVLWDNFSDREKVNYVLLLLKLRDKFLKEWDDAGTFNRQLLFCPVCGLRDEPTQSLKYKLIDNEMELNCSGCHCKTVMRILKKRKPIGEARV